MNYNKGLYEENMRQEKGWMFMPKSLLMIAACAAEEAAKPDMSGRYYVDLEEGIDVRSVKEFVDSILSKDIESEDRESLLNKLTYDALKIWTTPCGHLTPLMARYLEEFKSGYDGNFNLQNFMMIIAHDYDAMLVATIAGMFGRPFTREELAVEVFENMRNEDITCSSRDMYALLETFVSLGLYEHTEDNTYVIKEVMVDGEELDIAFKALYSLFEGRGTEVLDFILAPFRNK